MHKKKTPLDVLAKLLENPSHNLSVDVYNDDVEVIKERNVRKHKPKYTLNEIGSRMDNFETKLNQIGDALFEFIKTSNENFKQVNSRIDQIESRIDHIDTRLDYIVEANNLKDSK